MVDLPQGKVAIVASRYNAGICDRWSAVRSRRSPRRATRCRVDSRDSRSRCLGIARGGPQVIDQSDVIAAIALGCVIKGETTHDEHINRAVSLALMQMGVETGMPIAFGLLTCNTLEQAIHRSGGAVGNKGNEAAEAVIELLRLQPKIATGI